MKLRSLINTSMGQTVIITLLLAFFCPFVLYKINEKRRIQTWILKIILFLYVAGMFYLTIFDRKPGENTRVNLDLFWSYSNFHLAQYRWQIYMNILLFVPLGFLLPFSGIKKFIFVFIIGFGISAISEVTQYFLNLGMCELDDVFHNSFGTIIGFLYWKFLKRRKRD